MIAKIYRLHFTGGVHFGEGTLESSARTFRADTLFSALCLEALKAGKLGDLVKLAESGKLLFSDALPFDSQSLYVPKPSTGRSSLKDRSRTSARERSSRSLSMSRSGCSVTT